MSVRDPLSRIKSAYNWRKHICRTEGRSNRRFSCFWEEFLLFDACYTTLNAFSEGSCDGSMCGEGWDETNEYVRKLKGEGNPVHGCEDVRSFTLDRPNGTRTASP